ncbi:MAG: hypothetical protein HYU86_12380 [Chloroflexi bacterium]|nr:hypothetical protein [Chloroflexota bacterium]
MAGEKGFEQRARDFLSQRWGVKLTKRKVRIEGFDKKFDCVSEDQAYIGDAKIYSLNKRGDTPRTSKFIACNELALLLRKTSARHKFLIFGKERKIPETFIRDYGPLLGDVAIYFLDGGNLEVLHGKEPMSLRERQLIARNAFGIWADYEEVAIAAEYVERLRAEWEPRLKENRSGR